MKFVLTREALNIELCGRPYSISSQHPQFTKVRDLVLKDAGEKEVLWAIQEETRGVRSLIERSLAKRKLTGTLTYDEGLLYYDGRPLHNYAADTLIGLLNLGHDVTALANFIDKQQANPDPTVHEHLYAFLEHGKIPLTPDGDFLVYKAVRANYRDIHSGQFDNSIGAAPSVPRESVDPDRTQTCSRGLHVCSFAYLPHFSHADGHVMVCKVSPADVVAIPQDYNNTKMRVCRYEVVGEVTSYYKQSVDVLAQERLAEEHYAVRGCTPDGDWEDVGSFYTREDATEEADELINDGWSSAKVIDKRDGKVLYSR